MRKNIPALCRIFLWSVKKQNKIILYTRILGLFFGLAISCVMISHYNAWTEMFGRGLIKGNPELATTLIYIGVVFSIFIYIPWAIFCKIRVSYFNSKRDDLNLRKIIHETLLNFGVSESRKKKSLLRKILGLESDLLESGFHHFSKQFGKDEEKRK